MDCTFQNIIWFYHIKKKEMDWVYGTNGRQGICIMIWQGDAWYRDHMANLGVESIMFKLIFK